MWYSKADCPRCKGRGYHMRTFTWRPTKIRWVTFGVDVPLSYTERYPHRTVKYMCECVSIQNAGLPEMVSHGDYSALETRVLTQLTGYGVKVSDQQTILDKVLGQLNTTNDILNDLVYTNGPAVNYDGYLIKGGKKVKATKRPQQTKTTWVTSDERVIPVTNMDNEHIGNTLRLCVRKAYDALLQDLAVKAARKSNAAFAAMEREAKRRGINWRLK